MIAGQTSGIANGHISLVYPVENPVENPGFRQVRAGLRQAHDFSGRKRDRSISTNHQRMRKNQCLID
jgi:hypothetical protein